MVLSINEKFERLLEKFLPKFIKSINIDYGLGSAISIQNAKIQGKQTNMKPLSLTKSDKEANIEMIESLIKDVNEEVAKKINYAVNKNITEKGSNKDLAKDLEGIFDKDNPNYFNYKNRFQTIARTESTRILNTSADNTAKRLGANKKYISIVKDNRTSEQSKLFFNKYGSEEKAIPLDKEFSIKYNGKSYSGLYPPFMPNDRDMILYSFEE